MSKKNNKDTGTDRERLGKEDRIRVPPLPGERGPPKINRDLARRLLEAQRYSKVEIARALKCDESSVRNIEKELLESGELVYDEATKADFKDTVALDFDEECIRARGYSFYDWLKNATVKYRTLFNANRRYWVFLGKPSLVRMADDKSQFGAQKVQEWVTWANKDLKRRRRTKKQFRYLIRFLGRRDLCDLFLKLDESRDPREIRSLPEISLPGHPLKVQRAIDALDKINPDMATAVMFKLVSQMRTGQVAIYEQEGDDRGLYGMMKGGGGTNYFILDKGAFRSATLEKRRTPWTISWIPKEVLRRLTELYGRTAEGDYLFASKFSLKQWRQAWGDVTEKYIGKRHSLHDTRKFGITWLYAMDIPLERAIEINAGWKDMNTPKKHYAQYSDLMKLEERVAFQKNIPKWFKDGLDQYSRQSQYVELIALLKKEGLIQGGSSQ